MKNIPAATTKAHAILNNLTFLASTNFCSKASTVLAAPRLHKCDCVYSFTFMHRHRVSGRLFQPVPSGLFERRNSCQAEKRKVVGIPGNSLTDKSDLYVFAYKMALLHGNLANGGRAPHPLAGEANAEAMPAFGGRRSPLKRTGRIGDVETCKYDLAAYKADAANP